MLRFAMVTTFYPPYHFGGDALAVQRLTHALARRGHRVDVIHDIDAFRLLSANGEPPAPRVPANVRVHGLRSALRGLSSLATHQLGRPVVHGRRIQRILDSGVDVIHYHNVSLVGGPGILGMGRGIKLYTAHEHWLVCPTHVLWRHNREVCTGRECLRCVICTTSVPPSRGGPPVSSSARRPTSTPSSP
jgi:glycosyltransferase involved in cell wall biosynthesis